MIYDITNLVIDKNKEDERVPKIGRYSVSKLWGMLNGYLPPEKYLTDEMAIDGIMRAKVGTYKHLFLESLFSKHKTEIKKEYKTDDFTIVGKADILDLFGTDVCDFKTSKELKEMKTWDEYQIKWYCILFDKPYGYALQPRFNKTKAWLEVIGEVKRPTSKWLETQLKKIKEYHLKCEQLNK